MTNRSQGRLALALLVGLVGFGCATPQPQAPVETGQLVFWEAQAPGGQRLHLLGTLHIGRDHYAFDPAIQAALDDSDVLALELQMSELEPDAIGQAFARVGLLTDQTLFEAVSPETAELLHRWLEQSGTPEIAVRSVKPWAAWLMVISAAVESGGLDFDKGVESGLTDRAPPTLPTVGLESLDSQLATLDALPLEVQEDMLRASLEGALAPTPASEPSAEVAEAAGSSEFVEMADQLIEAWEKGDLDWIEHLVLGSATPEQVSDPVIFARNQDMAAGIERLIAQDKRPFVAVGAAHMIGDQGLPNLLRQRGYRVRRIPKSATNPSRKE
jgi:hypothetical protein